jgi:hypothetical protein
MFDVFEKLDKFNGIVFHEEEHKYLYDGHECVSVTTMIKNFEPIFDQELMASLYAKKHGLEMFDVLKDWENIRDRSATVGTEIHKYAEMRFGQKCYTPYSTLEIPVNLMGMIEDFYSMAKGRLIPVKMEWVVGDKDKGICGMVDKLFYNVKAKELQIWDYKTSKKIDSKSMYNKKMVGPLKHLDSCELVKFSLQLGVYKKIIEKNCQIKLGNSYICWVNEVNDSFKVIETLDLSNEVDLIWNAYEHI